MGLSAHMQPCIIMQTHTLKPLGLVTIHGEGREQCMLGETREHTYRMILPNPPTPLFYDCIACVPECTMNLLLTFIIKTEQLALTKISFFKLLLKLIRFGDKIFEGNCTTIVSLVFSRIASLYKLIFYHFFYSQSSSFALAPSPSLSTARAEQLNSLFPFTYPFVSTFTFIFE